MTFEDLTGDKVYDFLLDRIVEKREVVGGKIVEKKRAAHNEARKVIYLLMRSPVGEKIVMFNYNKVLRHI